MPKSILLTGATGFIGRNVARMLSARKYDYSVIVRPETAEKRLSFIKDQCEIIRLNLEDTDSLSAFLAGNRFRTIIHIGALRGGRRFPRKAYYDANVKATEQIALSCLENDGKLVFCSSVGVFGAIPMELPAGGNTEFQGDTLYHQTKIQAENVIQKYIMAGLKAIIVRPTITYGEEDFGFPYTLVKLVHRKLLFLPDTDVRIHLANIDIVASAFYKLVEVEYRKNTAYIIADRYPVKLHDLVDFISNRLRQKPYPRSRYISRTHFRRMAAFALRYGWVNLHNRIKLISNSWYYDSSEAFNDLYLRHAKTIPDFKLVVDWYKKIHKIR
jgi:nucleoside-diphosphate-sugar epimerase